MASGDSLLVWIANSGDPPATNFASLDTRNGILVLDFDDTTAETMQFGGVLPRHYAGGGITAVHCWAAATAIDAFRLYGLRAATHNGDIAGVIDDYRAAHSTLRSGVGCSTD